jgi:phosphate starvation-inducible PhoH-like protein
VACAVDALERAGAAHRADAPGGGGRRALGFLPGDLAQKVDPYLRPLYDALYDLMGFDKVAKASSATPSRSRRWPSCAGAR